MSRSLRVLIVLLATACAAAAVWWTRARQATPPAPRVSVVLITVDTLRADRLHRGFTPAMDALADSGMRFDNARTVVPLTLPSHVTIMTGALPAVHGVRDNGEIYKPGPPTLARQFHDAGYHTGAFVGAYVLNRRFGLADGFDVYDDAVHRGADEGSRLEAERRGGEVMDAALGWLAQAPRPFFLWVHLYDPHAPYDPPEDFRIKAGGQAYDGEVAYADAQVGRLLTTLRERGWLDQAIVALAGDHGEGLGDHGERAHGMLAYDSTLRVPLILAAPGVAPSQRVASKVSLSDLAPTIARLAGLRAKEAGLTLLDPQPGDRDVYAETHYPRVAGWHPLSALVYERWKLILSSEAELYDLDADPGEAHNIASAKASLVDGMSKRARDLGRAQSPASPASGVAPDAAERLRALGYVSSGPASTTGESGANPAAAIEAWGRFESALSDVTLGKPAAALPVLEALATRFPEAPVFQATYGRALKDAGRARDAMLVYRRAVGRWPNDVSLFHDLAVAARAAGDAGEATRAEQAALAIRGDDPAALNGLGLLQAEAGKAADAVRSFERAVEADPANASYWANLGNARRELGNLDGAEAAYRRALDSDASHPDATNGLGVLLVQRGRASEAIPLFEALLTRSPRFDEARLNLGIAYQQSGQVDQALSTYRTLLSTAPAASRERQAARALLDAASARKK